jgi:D-alanyl-D-alanine dipeptidase
MFKKLLVAIIIVLAITVPIIWALSGRNVVEKNLIEEDGQAPKPWLTGPMVSAEIAQNVLYLPISDSRVKNIPIVDSEEEIIDMRNIENPRLRPLTSVDSRYQNSYPEFGQVRSGVYKRLLAMLGHLPENIGIAYWECLRPLAKQKEYFDNKFREVLQEIKDKNQAYKETCRHVSPFIDNVPTHATGAAVDITLFEINENEVKLLDMGKFDTIFGPNEQQESFSANTTKKQRENRLILFTAAQASSLKSADDGSGDRDDVLVNYGHEWWHFSYGDKAWAYVKRQPNAIYGLAVAKDDPILRIKIEDYLSEIHK